MLYIGIVEDNLEFGEYLRKEIADIMKEAGAEGKVDYFQKARNFIYEVEERPKYRIVFIDISMPEIDGFELAKYINEYNAECRIVFVSAYPEYAFEGYEYHPFHFINKSCCNQKIQIVMKELMRYLDIDSSDSYELVKDSYYKKIYYHEIMYILKNERYTYFHTEKGSYKEKKSLNAILSQIDNSNFILVNRSSVINMDKVAAITGTKIEMSDGEEITISRPRIKEVKKEIVEYGRKKRKQR